MKKILFFLMMSSALAISVYFILWLIIPDNLVFGFPFPLRMSAYHYEHPIPYILIPCFVYSVIASLLSETFLKVNKGKRILLTVLIVLLTVFFSCPFGGMLWYYHDMQAGFFPDNWLSILLTQAPMMGWRWGFLIVGIAIPYNLIGSVICYFLTLRGAKIFQEDIPSPSFTI